MRCCIPWGNDRLKLRNGFTTGSCAAAAAKAATEMLLTGSDLASVEIQTPAGIAYHPAVEAVSREGQTVRCAVRKDAGDDPDVTNGTLIFATVGFLSSDGEPVQIEAGEGVGTVTRPGLDQPVGQPAINSVPRKMITESVREVMDALDCNRSVRVVISVPEGKKLAARTFNPRLGIEGGISIIGTTGVIEPMSTKALLATIRAELSQRKAEGAEIAIVSPGNYGLAFLKEHYGYDLDKAVKCSNYLGDTIDLVREAGYPGMLLIGHVGKLIKLSGGIFNTHSKEADCRMELLAAAAAKSGGELSLLQRILSCTNTEEACAYLKEAGICGSDDSHFFLYEKKSAGKSPRGVHCFFPEPWGAGGNRARKGVSRKRGMS